MPAVSHTASWVAQGSRGLRRVKKSPRLASGGFALSQDSTNGREITPNHPSTLAS